MIYSACDKTGILPHREINYIEVANLLPEKLQISKGKCKDFIELIFKKYSDLTWENKPVSLQIPHIGTLKIQNSIAAVIFDKSIIE